MPEPDTSTRQRLLNLPPTLEMMVIGMYKAGRALEFMEIIAFTPARTNTFRHLLRRGMICNVVAGYKPGEDYTGPRMPKYVLTDALISAVEAVRDADKKKQDEPPKRPMSTDWPPRPLFGELPHAPN